MCNARNERAMKSQLEMSNAFKKASGFRVPRRSMEWALLKQRLKEDVQRYQNNWEEAKVRTLALHTQVRAHVTHGGAEP